MKTVFKMTPIDQKTMVELSRIEREVIVALLEDELEKTEFMMTKHREGFIAKTWQENYKIIKPLYESLKANT
jgi:hypothetical protein